MEMEKKDIFLHSILFVITVFLMIIFSYLLFSSSLHGIEEEYAIHNTHMLIDEIEDDEIRVVSSSASNLALYAQYESEDRNSNDLYRVLSDDQLLRSHSIESILIYNLSTASLIFEHTITGYPSSDDIESYIISNPEVFSKCITEGSLSGLVFLPERTVVVAMECFSSGSGENESISVIVVSHMIDLNEIGDASDDKMPMVLEDIGYGYTAIDDVDRIAGNASPSSFEEGLPAGVVPLYDIMGNPVKLMKVGTMGQTTSEGLRMLLYLAVIIVFLSSIELFIHIFLAKNVNYAKFNLLVHGLGNIQRSGDLSSRIAIEGDDEVNWLADNINEMLGSLEDKEGKYHSLFEQSNDAIMLLGSGASLVDTNSKTSELLGYTHSALSTMDIRCLSPEGYSPNLVDIYKDTIKEGSVRSEIKLSLFSKREIYADISSSVIDKEKGTVQLIIRDITEKKIYEDALLNSKIEADTASRAKSEFLANMSHELRTPLNSIIGFSDMLLLKTFGSINEKQERYLNNVSNSGKHLLNIINDILDLSKIEAGMMEADMKEVSVTELVDEAIGTISSLASKKELSVTYHIDDDLLSINADRNKIKQTLLNLLSNAVKFTPENGSVDIRVEKRGNMARFIVTDTGIGISADDQKYLFYEFTQVDSAHNRSYEGTGLGLALVKKFVEMHEGKVWVESELGQGSSFYFEIPIDLK
ncbi:sensor histidine kinase [Methanolobus profundi]|uniref:histidine kinase n=1 Tax=Methanolobus profundi TaxID=487685 RepID=A0A1I4T0B2_9EURY|nr:ATP-binding protein [Methanolobus profundi]SFM70208.1 His Kinase A (phospho-acceptor) domain-containing protein [Methanolobus profundi]